MFITILALIGLVVVAGILLTAVMSLTVFEFVVLVLVWMLVGWLTGQLVSRRGFGAVNNALLGLGGGIIGSFIFGILKINVNDLMGSIISGVVGSIILIYIVRTFLNQNFAK